LDHVLIESEKEMIRIPGGLDMLRTTVRRELHEKKETANSGYVDTLYNAIQEMIGNLQALTKDDIRELSQEELDTLEYMVIFIDDIS